MRIIIALLLMALMLTAVSCDSPTDSSVKHLKKVAVQELFYSYGWNAYDGMTIKYVDSLYGVGDTIILNAVHYVVRKD